MFRETDDVDFDFLIVNDRFDATAADMQAIFLSSRQRRQVQTERYAALIEALLRES